MLKNIRWVVAVSSIIEVNRIASIFQITETGLSFKGT